MLPLQRIDLTVRFCACGEIPTTREQTSCSLNSSLKKRTNYRSKQHWKKPQCLARAAFFPEAKKGRNSKLHKAKKEIQKVTQNDQFLSVRSRKSSNPNPLLVLQTRKPPSSKKRKREVNRRGPRSVWSSSKSRINDQANQPRIQRTGTGRITTAQLQHPSLRRSDTV